MSDSLPNPLVDIVMQCVTEFAADANVGALQPIETLPITGDVLAAVIGFTGAQLNGSLTVTTSRQLAMASHPNIPMGMPVEDRDLSDWIGEIANQLLGRIKNRVLRYGYDISLSTPTVLTAQNLKATPAKQQPYVELCFAAAPGHLAVRLAARIPDGLQWVESDRQSAAAEGESLLF